MTENDSPEHHRVRILRVAPGKKIQSIKEIRAACGVSLKDAKDIADRVELGQPVVVDAYVHAEWTYTGVEVLPVTVSVADLVDVLSRFPPDRTVRDVVDILRVVRDFG